jgi:hypothetical protein
METRLKRRAPDSSAYGNQIRAVVPICRDDQPSRLLPMAAGTYVVFYVLKDRAPSSRAIVVILVEGTLPLALFSRRPNLQLGLS